VTGGGPYQPAEVWPEVAPAPGVRRKVLSCGEHLMVVQISLAPAAEVPLHTHPHEQIGHVVSGRMRLRIGAEERELGPGDGYAIPGDVEHAAIGVTDVVAVDSFYPVRDEYR
jgi:quercetin dioxygenase-like cupin family protein